MTIVAANWVGENTSTVGTGPLALSGAISTFCPFSVLPDWSEVYYTLQEGFNRETGIGVVYNGTLTRNVQATLVAGVYTETDIPISLVGNGQVFAVINADFMTRIYNFSLDVADSVAAAAASAKASADFAALANNYETQSEQNAENASLYAQSASDSKISTDASKTAAANSASAAANSKTDAAASAQAAADSATAAAGSAMNSLNSATDSANSAANAAAAIVSAVKSIVTFTTGGTLNSNLDRISDGTYLYYWTGSYPVTVPANSTVDGTGGINIGAWACDTDLPLRQNLGSNEDSFGASLVGLTHGGTVQDALHNVINVEAFKSYNISDGDWGPAFRAAIAYAESLGGGVVQFTGNYTITSTDSVGWVLPFDDGTIDPNRISAGTDSTLSSEEQITIGVHLNIPSGVSLIGGGVETSSITFAWDWSSKPINTSQHVGICIRVINWDGTYVAKVGAKNRMTKVVINTNIGGFRINNAFIPVLADGIMVYGEWPEISFNQCAFSVIALGSEMTKFSGFYGSNTLSGPIIGGWWLQRNELEYQGGVKVPPYVASTDVYSLGWCDSIVIKVLKYDFPYWSNGAFSVSYKLLDKFFDDYFWKTKNSMRAGETTPSGEPGVGRLSTRGSNYTSPSTLQAKNPFRGIATRALSIIPRYNRGNSANRVMDLKTRGTSRPPILVGPSSPSGNVVSIDNAFVERSCLADMGNTSSGKVGGTNDWFTVGGDIWNADITQTPYYVGQNLVTTVFVSSAASIAAMPSHSNQGGNGNAVNTIIGPNTDTTNLSRTTLYDPSTGQWSLVREAYKNHDYIPKIRFTSNENYSAAYMFVHAEKILNPDDIAMFSLSVGTYTALSPSVLKCKMVRMGSVVRCYVIFTLTSTDVENAGQFVIGLRRYSVYDPSKGNSADFAGSRPLLSICRGAFASDSVVPKTVENAGVVTVNNVSYHMMKMFSSYNGNTAFAVSGMSTANGQSWVIEYESFSPIDSITLV